MRKRGEDGRGGKGYEGPKNFAGKREFGTPSCKRVRCLPPCAGTVHGLMSVCVDDKETLRVLGVKGWSRKPSWHTLPESAHISKTLESFTKYIGTLGFGKWVPKWKSCGGEQF